MDFKKEVVNSLKKAGIKNASVEKPPKNIPGDLAFPCFELARNLKKNPVEIAKEFSSKLKRGGNILRIEPVGPYINFFADYSRMASSILKCSSSKSFGRLNKKGKALIEHTSTNPNASPHVGRVRCALIGDSVSRLMKFCGHDTEVHYWVNDIGKQIAMLVYAINEMEGKPSFNDMLRKYIEINRRVIENVQLEKEIFELLNKIESGDKKTIKEFEKVISTCVKGQAKLFNEIGIKYDVYDYESSLINSSLLKKTLESLSGKTKRAKDGRLVLDLTGFKLPMREPYLPLTRADGTSLYFLRDVVYNVYKAKKAGKGKNIVVLGEDHKLEFQQISSAMKILGCVSPEVIHYSYILLPDGKMSTRKGNVVLLEDFMKEALEKARNEIVKRNPEMEDEILEKISRKIGYGAIKYSILKITPDKNVTFIWEDALNFEGNSAPYIQYTYVRGKRILEKTGSFRTPKKIILETVEEQALLKKFSEFPGLVSDVYGSYEISKIAKYSYEIAELFNRFYEKCPVLNEKNNDKKLSRLKLTKNYVNLIKSCLGILGIDVPEVM